MQAILETLARYLAEAHEGESDETRIILPNRRAGLFLQRNLARYNRSVAWAPRIYAINDFIDELSQLEPADPVESVFLLYDLYKDMKEAAEPVDEFYHWGEIMLHDFDEMDKYLVDPDLLFRNIADLKEIEEPFAGLEPSQLAFIRQFWEGFFAGDDTPEKKHFLEMWKILPQLYSRLRRELHDRGEGYQGMQYREIAERIGLNTIPSPGGRIIIAGFNALNGCEKRIFSWLQKHEAELFWDYDQHYIDDPGSEAGRFMRDNLLNYPPTANLESFNSMQSSKKIRIFELPTDLLQAKTVHRILEERELPGNADSTDTAVILCDEELLMPLLMSVPQSTGEVNVTMGYPMKSTPVAGFTEALLRMQNNSRRAKDGTVSFYYKDVQSILLHPYMERAGTGTGDSLLDDITKRNLIQVEQGLFHTSFEKMIFRQVEDSDDLIGYLREIFLHILEIFATGEEKLLPELHREFVLRILIHLNRLETLLSTRPGIPIAIFERLFRKVLSLMRIPFEGEPLSGLQVMGILETRMLDFRHVILLSMNEEVMPASQFRHSYIPYALRLAFGMPSREDMDGIYAYYFYRLLQRAERVDLLYNSTSEGVRTGEMSRYLQQLIFNRGVEVRRPGVEVMAREPVPVVVQHSPEIDQKLELYTTQSESKKFLSPSAINAYIDCSLKFYLRYIARIGEPDEVEEEIGAAGFGTVVHETIRELYEEITAGGKGVIEREALEQLKNSERIGEVLTRTFMEHHYKGRRNAVPEGRNIIILKVMLRYLIKIIETDEQIAPFDLVSAELTYQRELGINCGTELKVIRIGGLIDRVDRVGEVLRVIDYKTGNAQTGFSSLEALFNGSLSSRNGAALQTLLYSWLVLGKHPDEQVSPGLYIMKSLYDSQFDPRLVMGSHSNREVIDSFAKLGENFLERLEETLIRLFDPGVDFAQTDNESICKYCDFSKICSRQTIE
ncbi:MAG: hypothetical protein GY790_11435 [Bacteroidetes bacterium]|nr:hypothetical protein [Bacteroidota bacterium]